MYIPDLENIGKLRSSLEPFLYVVPKRTTKVTVCEGPGFLVSSEPFGVVAPTYHY